VPISESVSNLLPVIQVLDRIEGVSKIHDVIKRDRHTAASQWVAHIPRISEENDTLFRQRATLLDRRQERVGHATDSIFRKRITNRIMQ